MKAQQPTKLILHQYDYPGWQARLDDSLTLAVSANRQGLLQVWIPAGQHTLTLKLAARLPEQWGIGLSLFGWLCWLVLACLGANTPKRV